MRERHARRIAIAETDRHSLRETGEKVRLNLAYGWFCRLGLDGDVPDHPTFSKNRHGRFRESDLLGGPVSTKMTRYLPRRDRHCEAIAHEHQKHSVKGFPVGGSRRLQRPLASLSLSA
jgi:hypothetical protein